jgi:hypothetical protein
MEWSAVRQQHPERWLLVEALRAHSEHERRVVEDLSVLASFTTSTEALRAYLARHREMPQRELYVVHTHSEALEITERTWLGVRGSP